MNHFISSVSGFQASQNKSQKIILPEFQLQYLPSINSVSGFQASQSKSQKAISPKASLQYLPSSSATFFTNILNNSTLHLKVIVLQKTYMPTILTHDAMYLVVTGKGVFCKGSNSQYFIQGDTLLANKGTQHFFESYEKNTIIWQLFYNENK